MKILLLSPLPPWRGGIAQFGRKLLHTLKKVNQNTEGVNFMRLYPPPLFPGKTQLEEKCGYPQGILHGYDPVRWAVARRKIKAMSPDLVITQWWHPFFAPCLSASVPDQVKKTAICHNVIPHESFPLSGNFARCFFEKQDLLAVHSEESLHEAAAFSPKKVRLFHPVYDQYLGTGLDRVSARAELGLESHHTALLFFGLIRDYKGFDLLIDACEMLPESYRVIAAGENYTGKNYKSERLTWNNSFIPDREVGTWFNAADIVVLPYRSATQSGIAQIALAFGKPLVVTPAGGLPETVENGITGFISEDVSSESLADAILRCREIAGRKETVSAIAEKADSFSWETYGKLLLEASS